MARTAADTASKTEDGLSLLEEEFCQTYLSPDRDFFGNGVQSYIEVYEPDKTKENWYNVACVQASQLLSKVKVINRINVLLEEGGFNDRNVDKQHLFLINQHGDLKTKMAAIKEFNNLKKRIDNKIELVLPKPILELNELLQDKRNTENNLPE